MRKSPSTTRYRVIRLPNSPIPRSLPLQHRPLLIPAMGRRKRPRMDGSSIAPLPVFPDHSHHPPCLPHASAQGHLCQGADGVRGHAGPIESLDRRKAYGGMAMTKMVNCCGRHPHCSHRHPVTISCQTCQTCQGRHRRPHLAGGDRPGPHRELRALQDTERQGFFM